MHSADDITFLVRRARAVKQVIANATQKTPPTASSKQSPEGEQGNKWFGPLPYLCLIHCPSENNIKDKWIHQFDPKTIQEIDAHRSEVCEENVFELITNCWNDETFNPSTMISNCHYDFSQEIDIGYEAISNFTKATLTKVKDKFAKMRTDLMSIIDKWERSGQGDSGILHKTSDDE